MFGVTFVDYLHGVNLNFVDILCSMEFRFLSIFDSGVYLLCVLTTSYSYLVNISFQDEICSRHLPVKSLVLGSTRKLSCSTSLNGH